MTFLLTHPAPTAKALELFMIRLITSSADVAKSRNSKKVLSQHMKAAVMQDEQFDNLRDIVGKIPDAPSKSSAASGAAANGGDEDGDEEVKPKRGRAAAAAGEGGAKRGKKRRDSDDF